MYNCIRFKNVYPMISKIQYFFGLIQKFNIECVFWAVTKSMLINCTSQKANFIITHTTVLEF